MYGAATPSAVVVGATGGGPLLARTVLLELRLVLAQPGATHGSDVRAVAGI